MYVADLTVHLKTQNKTLGRPQKRRHASSCDAFKTGVKGKRKRGVSSAEEKENEVNVDSFCFELEEEV